MAKRQRFASAILLLLVTGLLGGCKPRPKSSVVVVRTVRDLQSIYGNELDRRILDFQGSNPRLQSGQQIVIASENGDYKDMLQRVTSNNDTVDLIILDAPDDAKLSSALEIALPQAPNVCAGLKACPAVVPAIIPPQIKGNEREAAQKFVDFLQKAPAS